MCEIQDNFAGLGSRPDRQAQASTGRFEALDGMRGVAAIVVLIFHLRFFFPDVPIPPHGYLAVDLFFGLSGFVLAHAYGRKMIGGMTVLQFMTLRFARLYPMYILGTSFLVVLLALSLPRSAPDLLPLVFAVFMAPSPITDQLYPLNVPAWSLFLELLINLAMIVLWRRLSISVIVLTCLASGICLAGLAVHYGGLDYGHRWEAFPIGLARVTYSFFMGIALQLTDVRLARVHPLVSMSALLAIFLMPVSPDWTVAWDLFAVLVAFPALLAAGAYAKVSGWSLRFCKWSGDISYPLYATHGPILVWCSSLVKKLHLPVTSLTIAIVILVAIAVAWMAEIFFDGPVRQYLRN